MRKRNILKRNSGFIAATIIAAGASFFTADTVLTELKPGSKAVESESEGAVTEAPQKESSQTATYETNPFTITASGAVINQVESEALGQQETKPEASSEQESTPETDADGNIIENSQENGENAAGTSGNSGVIEGASNSGSGNSGSGSGDGSGGSSSGADSWAGSSGGSDSSGSSSWDGTSGGSGSGSSSSSGNGSYGGSNIEILDSGGGSYTDNSSGGSGSSGGNGSSGTGSSGGSYENGIYSPDNLILWHINSRYISEEELYNYDAATIRLIRNEIFALHGRIFLSEDLQAYFSQKSWYVPMYEPEAFDENMESYLNDYELANLNVILAYEEALNG